MEWNIRDLIQKLDQSFIPLGHNAVRESEGEGKVVVPKRAKDWGLFSPTNLDLVHIGKTPDEYEYFQDDEEANDPTIPYLVLSKYQQWLDNHDYLEHHDARSFSSNRRVSLGVEIVPEVSTRPAVAAVPKVHQLAVGDIVTFWVRPCEWRANKFLYMLKERYAKHLYDVFENAPDEIEARTDEDVIEDGGWDDPETFLKQERSEDDPLLIEGVLTQPLDHAAVDRWLNRGYTVDVNQNRAIAVPVVQDLLGTSGQVSTVLAALEAQRDPVPDKEEIDIKALSRSTLRALLEEGELHVDELQPILTAEYPGLPDKEWPIAMEMLKAIVFPDWASRGIIEENPQEQLRKEAILRLSVRPTAVYAALELLAEHDTERSD